MMKIAGLIFLSGRTCTIGDGLNTFLPHCTLKLLTKKTVNVPEWPSHRFKFNLLKSMARLENGCLATELEGC